MNIQEYQKFVGEKYYFFRVSFLCILFLRCFAFGELKRDPKAYEINQKGLQAYYKKDYNSAIGYFKKTIEADPNSVAPYINLASVYSLILQNEKSHNEKNYINEKTEIFLEKAYQLNPDYLSIKMAEDTDINSIRKETWFLVAIMHNH